MLTFIICPADQSWDRCARIHQDSDSKYTTDFELKLNHARDENIERLASAG
jgi:hypothetical protein